MNEERERSAKFLNNPWMYLAAVLVGLGLCAVLLVRFHSQIYDLVDPAMKRPKEFKAYVLSWGQWAPLVFMGLQILQVVLAPIPGEATGFLGGFIFGFAPGFLYSTAGLTIGSFVNLIIGRYLGRRIVERFLPPALLQRFDFLLRVKAIFLIFLLFVIPGFPKDYLCLVLGMSRLPLRLLLITAAVGRIPGTLILSLQGANLYSEKYLQVILITVLSLAFMGPAYLIRDHIYRWSKRWERKPRGPFDGASRADSSPLYSEEDTQGGVHAGPAHKQPITGRDRLCGPGDRPGGRHRCR